MNSLLLSVLLLFSLSSFAATVSDRLVENLNCQNISAQEIYSKIRSNAYSVQAHIPTENWSSAPLGMCWSLAHSQRIYGERNVDSGIKIV